MRFACVVGARPNFMKMAPILRALEQYPHVSTKLIHTGQHYDRNLSDVFFEDLQIRKPDVSLGVGSGSHARQTAEIMIAIEQEIIKDRELGAPWSQLIVVGDVNSTAAAAIAAAKLETPIAHVEAGLRSCDRTMPEEINRILTDSISTDLFVSEPAGVENLRREGHPDRHIHLVGNVMIDTLFREVASAKKSTTLADLGVQAHEYGVITLHRPSNVDDPVILKGLIDVIVECAARLPMVFPIHPRTRARLREYGLESRLVAMPHIKCMEPLGYTAFLGLTSQARLIVTDSGGLQEESTALGVPCLTMRANTERPITVEEGTSTLIGNSASRLREYLDQVLRGVYKTGVCPRLWDGCAAQRIAKLLVERNGGCPPPTEAVSRASL